MPATINKADQAYDKLERMITFQELAPGSMGRSCASRPVSTRTAAHECPRKQKKARPSHRGLFAARAKVSPFPDGIRPNRAPVGAVLTIRQRGFGPRGYSPSPPA